ncbi:hypothetical protein RRF57_001601 [Xylaria bambusicola]|uniref:Uncharacterized protein n=1 Tax=Xylaria bambusicola TaxID=326684 RepID=A0AAN7U5Q9_9PEZI
MSTQGTKEEFNLNILLPMRKGIEYLMLLVHLLEQGVPATHRMLENFRQTDSQGDIEMVDVDESPVLKRIVFGTDKIRFVFEEGRGEKQD